ncbi:MAG: hypothetical protein NZ879_08555, partial [Archaeoglobaceae archaeon]|nr:hypothetical protein [Archaeoglobaceae archaeon]MDW8119014.1 hypothetical protein [Archaeoglobaceae archaeon]
VFWLEIAVKTDKEIREYFLKDIKIVEIERMIKEVEIEEKISEEELARMILRQVDYMFNVLNYDRNKTIERIAEIYGLRIDDAKAFVEYAEAQLNFI